ncbi:hypothetical protein ACJMK2_040941 [Sinanodonta woodiana]|uniref:Protein kinase domain-containing protein n=1 Tax=Sinanodonta woodiana TaxID=1069815 RepID=A0ABD3W6A1_SINWO
MASTTNGIISVYICIFDDENLFHAYDIKATPFKEFKARLEKGYIVIINCKHIHYFVTCYTMEFSVDLLSAVTVGNWHYEHVRGIQHSISLLNVEGEQQFRKRVEDIRNGSGVQCTDTEWNFEGNKTNVDTIYEKIPDEETAPKKILNPSKNEYSKMPTVGEDRASNIDGELGTHNELITESRFVEAETMLPPDSDSGAGVYVWEHACIPDSRNRIISTDPETILEKLRQKDDTDNFEKQILGQFLPQQGRDWGITNLSRLLFSDSAKIRYSVIEIIEHICYRSSPSGVYPDDFIAAAETTVASIIMHIGDEKCVAQLSYILLLILSMVFLQNIATKNVFYEQHGKHLEKYCIQLSELKPKQHISIRYFIEFLQNFMQGLHENVKDLNKGHWLQMENWDEISQKADYIRKEVLKCNPCDKIAVMVLLLNLIHRLDDTDLTAQLLMDIVKEALHPTVGIRFKIRRSRSKQHAIALLISRGCRHVLETKSLIEAQASAGLRQKIRDILSIVLDTKEHTRHMVSEQLKCLSFYKTSDIKSLVAEKIVREGKFTDVCLHYICHKLKRTKITLHCNNSSIYKEWAICPGYLGNMRIKTMCFVGNKDGNNSKSHRTSRTSSRYRTKEAIDHNSDEVDNNLSTLALLQSKNVHSNIVQLIAYQWKTDPKFFVVEEPNGVKLQEYLLLKRNQNDWLSDLKLIFIVKQALSAVQHLHDLYIVHRDLTSARFKICPESMTLKLVDFRLAKETNNQDVIVCLNEETRLAVRWTSPESQDSDKYSFRSDVYMFGHLMLEIWTHGCWPFSEHHDKSTDNIMEMVVRGGLKPKQPRCVPNEVFKAMLSSWETEEKRISTKVLMEDLNNLLELYSERKGTRSSATQQIDENYPTISKLQLERNHEPEYGVQRAVLSIKVTKESKCCHTLDGQGTCTVSEALLPLSISQTVPRLKELKKISGAIQLELNYHNDNHNELVFQYPTGKKLRDVAMATTDVKMLLRVLLNTAKLVAEFHNAGWIMRSICAFDLWVAEEDEKVFPLRLSRCCAFPPSENWIIDYVFTDRQHWLPIETLRDEEYTKEGDVYQFAMTVVEVFNILDLSGPKKHLLSSIPFASINNKTDLENALLRGELPQRPNKCPERLFAVLKRCMSREKISRPQIQDVLSCIMNCIGNITESTTAGFKRQRVSTLKDNSETEYYVNANNKSVYKDPVETKQCGDKSGSNETNGRHDDILSNDRSEYTNDRHDILSNDRSEYTNERHDILSNDRSEYTNDWHDILCKDQSEYTNVSASKEMKAEKHNKISIKENTNILSKNQNVSVHDAEDMCTNSISDSSIVEGNEYSYSFEHKDTPQRSIINSSHETKIQVPEDSNIMQGRAPLSKQNLDSEAYTESEVVVETRHMEMKMSEHQDYTIQKMSTRKNLLEASYNTISSEGMDDVSEEQEISTTEKGTHWSKNRNVSVKGTYNIYPSGVEKDVYSYETKENLPSINVDNCSNQAGISVSEQVDTKLQRRVTLPCQNLHREHHIDADVGQRTFHHDTNNPTNIPDHINFISKKTHRFSKLSKFKLRFKRRFWSSKSRSATPNGDIEPKDGDVSASSSNGTMSSSSGGSLMFCNESTSGTSVKTEAEEDVVYDEIPEYDYVPCQYPFTCGYTYESDSSGGKEPDIFPLKENQDNLPIKESCSLSTTPIVIENDSLQTGSTEIHATSPDGVTHHDISFENEDIYDSSSVTNDSIILEEGDAIKSLDEREN